MPTAFFGDVLRNHDDRSKKGFYVGQQILRFRSHPGSNTHINHSYKTTKTSCGGDEPAAYKVSNGTTLKHSCMDGEISSKAKINNDNISYEATYKPKEHNTKEISASGKFSVNYTPSSSAWNVTGNAKFGAPETGPARIWSTLDFNTNSKQEMHVKPTVNVQIENDYHLGVKADHDTKKLCSAQGHFVIQHEHGDCFLRADTKDGKHKVTAGCNLFCGDAFPLWNAMHFTYDVSKETKGIAGHPVTASYAGQYKVNDSMTAKAHIEAGDSINMKSNFSHKVNENVTMTISDQYDLKALLDRKSVV